jgi:hypothetical protein
MSHLVKQKSDVKITDLDTLSDACKRIPGLQLHKDRKIAKYYGGATTKCDATISVAGTNNEIAVIKQADGSYEIATDLFDSKIRNAVSTEKDKSYGEAACDKLFQAYRVEETVNEAINSGWTVDNVVYDPSTNEYCIEGNYGY